MVALRLLLVPLILAFAAAPAEALPVPCTGGSAGSATVGVGCGGRDGAEVCPPLPWRIACHFVGPPPFCDGETTAADVRVVPGCDGRAGAEVCPPLPWRIACTFVGVDVP